MLMRKKSYFTRSIIPNFFNNSTLDSFYHIELKRKYLLELFWGKQCYKTYVNKTAQILPHIYKYYIKICEIKNAHIVSILPREIEM